MQKEIDLKIEAILFSYGDFVNIDLIQETLNITKEKVTNSIKNITEKYNNIDFSFQIFCENDKYKMGLKEEYQEIINDILSRTESPPTHLKVLSIIAYEGPLTKTGLNKILGKSVIDEIISLHSQGFIQYKKKGIGKYYKVTQKFFDYFKINSENLREDLNKKLINFSEDEEK